MSRLDTISERPDAVGMRRLYTYDQLAAELPESNQPCELWDGELFRAPAPFYQHQRIAFRLQKALNDWVERFSLGEVVGAPIDMVLSPHRAVQPDIAFISRDRLSIVQDVIRGPADLIVEIISPGGRTRDRIEKKDLYEQHGIGEYWIVDPEAKTVEVFKLESNKQYHLRGRWGSGEKAASGLLSDFVISVDEILGSS